MPMFADMPILLTRFVPGVNASATVQFVNQGYISRTSDDYSALGRIGGSEWTIDGATNNGRDRGLATSPNAEMLQSCRPATAKPSMRPSAVRYTSQS
jgi:hypothetical protein